jgi:hypothetical protein
MIFCWCINCFIFQTAASNNIDNECFSYKFHQLNIVQGPDLYSVLKVRVRADARFSLERVDQTLS